MDKDPLGGADDHEPGTRRNGSAPPKKPLTQFLAEFEQRLLDHPDEAATSALQVVEDRAGGRRQALPGSAGRSPGRPDSVSDRAATPVARASLPVSATAPAERQPIPGSPEVEPPSEVSNPGDGNEAEPAASTSSAAEARRLRGRRRRRHRHRAH